MKSPQQSRILWSTQSPRQRRRRGCDKTMGVYKFVCRSSGGEWSAEQVSGDLEAWAASTFELQRKLVQAAFSADSSSGVQSSFSMLTPSSAVFQVCSFISIQQMAPLSSLSIPETADFCRLQSFNICWSSYSTDCIGIITSAFEDTIERMSGHCFLVECWMMMFNLASFNHLLLEPVVFCHFIIGSIDDVGKFTELFSSESTLWNLWVDELLVSLQLWYHV